MNTRIHKLDSVLANQIAAGEVVERPGAALKELVENSLDAGADWIQVRIRGSGLELLEVSDSGSGINPEDLKLALDRHATSKIFTTDDLMNIRTWGFRGEALASIAAISRLTMVSRTAEQESGQKIVTEGGELKSSTSESRQVGTTVSVRELFYNVPARKKFLKSPAAETGYCIQNLLKMALSSPEVTFEIYVDDTRSHILPKVSDIRDRIVQVYHELWNLKFDRDELIPFESIKASGTLRGWILPSRFNIPTNRGLICLVNKRLVKDKLMQQAVTVAAKETLFGHQFPQMLLDLQIDPAEVDVNVHPTKSEVRFRDSGLVFGWIRKYVEKSLSKDRPQGIVAESVDGSAVRSLFDQENLTLGLEQTTHFHQKPAPLFGTGFAQFGGAGELSATAQDFSLPASAPAATVHQGTSNSPVQLMGTLRNTYILCQDQHGILLIDQHAAHERVTYENLKRANLANITTSPLLIPIQIEIHAKALDALELNFPQLQALGFHLDRGGPGLLTVREIPSLLMRNDGTALLRVADLIRKIAENFDHWNEQPEVLVERFKELLLDRLASQSCHGSVRAGQSLSAIESRALIVQMKETDFAGFCPHGRPTTARLSWEDIERMFKRIQ